MVYNIKSNYKNDYGPTDFRGTLALKVVGQQPSDGKTGIAGKERERPLGRSFLLAFLTGLVWSLAPLEIR